MKSVMSALLLIGFLLGSVARGDEPAERFLEALRANGYYDLALHYLVELEDSPLIGEEFRRQIPFEKAEILIDSVGRANSIEDANQILEEADQLLQQYAATAIEPEQKAKTLLISGNLYMKRGELFLRQMDADRLTAGERDAFREQARGMLEKANQNYGASRQVLTEVLRNFKVDPADPASLPRRDRLRARFTNIRLKQPVVTEQLADTHDVGSPTRQQLLQKAAAEYKDVMDDYRTYRAGLNACLSAARCELKLGKPAEALFLLESLFELQVTGATRDIRREALALATQCWEQQETFPFQEVITVLEPAVRMLNKEDQRHPDWLQVQLSLARAYRAKADFVVNREDPPQPGAPALARRLNRDAVLMGKSVARVPGELQTVARELLAEWNAEIGELPVEEEVEPETFVDARQKGQDIVSDIEGILQEIGRLEAEQASGNADVADALEDARQRLASQTETALELFARALELRTPETERTEINRVRYYQSFCYFALGRYYDSALIGEFLLERYPTLDWTRQAAGLAVRSYAELVASEDGPQPFETAQMEGVADRLIAGWPGTPEASLAARLMAISALTAEDYPEAARYLELIPRDYSLRNSLAARLGRGLWFDYLNERGTDPAEVQQQKLDAAQSQLAAAVENVDRDELNYELALASLLLVDAYLESGETGKALNQLESAPLAPMDLLKAQAPAIVSSPNAELYRKETWKTAIRTYLAALKTSDNTQQLVDKTRGVLQALEADAAASNDSVEKGRLAAIYRMIAGQLKEQFDQLKTPAERQAFGKTIGAFLSGIEANATDAKTALWAGATLMEIADAFAREGLVDDAQRFFNQAIPALNRAEEIGFGSEPNAEAYTTELKRQRALAQRGAGDFPAALEQLAGLLKESPNRLNVQLDAARTLQEWGRSTGDAEKFAEAMMGSEKVRDPESGRMVNAIWGWRKIFTVTRNREEFIDQYYTALYYLIESRFEYGVLKPSAKAIQSAQVELQNARRRDPDLGGAGWTNRFTELEKRIEQALNK